MREGPAIRTAHFKCSGCELPTDRRRCVCGHDTLPLVDRRPVLLSPELRRLVEDALVQARREAEETRDRARARLLRRLVVPHFVRVLREHRTAERRRLRGAGGYRVLTGSVEAQMRRVSRMGGRGRSAGGPAV